MLVSDELQVTLRTSSRRETTSVRQQFVTMRRNEQVQKILAS